MRDGIEVENIPHVVAIMIAFVLLLGRLRAGLRRSRSWQCDVHKNGHE